MLYKNTQDVRDPQELLAEPQSASKLDQPLSAEAALDLKGSEPKELSFDEITSLIESGQTHLIPNNETIPGGVTVCPEACFKFMAHVVTEILPGIATKRVEGASKEETLGNRSRDITVYRRSTK